MKKIIIRDKAAQAIRQGYPLIQPGDLETKTPEATTQWVEFVDSKQRFLGTGYLGQQNKGLGWVLNWLPNEKINQYFFEQKFERAFSLRQSFFQDDQTTAFRIFNGEGDGIGGLTIDYYEDYLVFSWYNSSIYHYQQELLAACLKVLPQTKGVYQKNRYQGEQLTESQHIWGEVAPEPLIVKENGVNFATYLDEGLMTGIFLDQKEVRGYLTQGISAGKTVLNTFSYTGAFSVAAAIGGASQTTSVDLAKRSLEKTKEQFLVNQIDPETQNIIVMDVFNYFNYAQKKHLNFDIVVLDPPSFARSKKRTFSVAKNYGELVADAAPLVAADGLLIASTNAANLSYNKFREMVEKGIQTTGRRFSLVQSYQLPADFVVSPNFSEGNYLKVLFYKIK